MAMDVKFTRGPGWDREFNSPNGMVGQHLRRVGAQVEAVAKSTVGVRTGKLKASIRAGHVTRSARGLEIEIGSPLNYALAHHQGSRPHVIVLPPNSPGGRPRTVVHPGTRANRYLLKGLVSTGARITYTLPG